MTLLPELIEKMTKIYHFRKIPSKSKYFSILLLSIFLLIWLIIIAIEFSYDSNEKIVPPSNFRILKSKSKTAFQQNPKKFIKELSKEEVSSGNLRIAQDDERLLRYISEHHLVRPGNSGPVDWSPVHLTKKNEQQEVSRFVMKLFQNKKQGTFIECGANDGEFFSNTMLLEKDFDWTGILIESDPRPLKKLLKRNRRSWIAKSCLSTNKTPKKMEFLRHDKDEGLSFIPGKRQFIGNEEDYYAFEAQCFPLYSILKAVNFTIIDYFSLDIEGAELDVLKTVPWDKVLIKLLSIEVHPEYVKPMRKFMTSVGYKYITFIKNGYSHDQIYAHPTVLKELNFSVTKNRIIANK